MRPLILQSQFLVVPDRLSVSCFKDPTNHSGWCFTCHVHLMENLITVKNLKKMTPTGDVHENSWTHEEKLKNMSTTLLGMS